MNIKRGCLRLWLVLSLLWVCFVMYGAREDFGGAVIWRSGAHEVVSSASPSEKMAPQNGTAVSDSPIDFAALEAQADAARTAAPVPAWAIEAARERSLYAVRDAFLPPIGVLIGGWIVAWIIQGFGRRSPATGDGSEG